MSAQISELVTLAKNGSAEAFGELYEIYYKDMYCENEKKKSVVYLDDENRGFDEPSVLDDLDISIELRNALQALAPDEREIVLLSVVSDYKSHEIAEILDCPSSTVRSKLKRSLEKLRRRMGGDT